MYATVSQIKIIHTLKSVCRIDDATYREMLFGYGVKSSKSLVYSDARDMISRLSKHAESLGTWSNSEPKEPTRFSDMVDRPGKATIKQLRMVESAWVDVSHQKTIHEARMSLNVFLESRFGISRIEWIDKNDVRRIMSAISAMRDQKTSSI